MLQQSKDLQATFLASAPIGYGRRAPWSIDLRLLVALLSALFYHGALSIGGSYRNTYDAYVHIFFADHWRRSWFDHWDTRWYTGFTLTSYPPLSQQSVAAVAFLTDDLRLAFAIVQTAAMVVMTLGIYRFARLWVSEEAAGWAALWLVFSSAMAETVHVFGQLPTTYSLALLLNALPFTYAWISRGKAADLAKGWALIAATTGAHHVTTLFGSVFITAPVLLLALAECWRTARPDETGAYPRFVTRANWRALVMRRLRRVLGPLIRCGLFGSGTIVLLVLVVFPYWVWSRSDPIAQVPIPHASRDNFLVNLNAGLIFWLIPYGMLLFAIPYIFYKGFLSKAWPLTSSIALLAFLGTGGTTPLPRLLLGGAYDILTLDRFTLWASILMLPLAGEYLASLLHGNLARWLQGQFGWLVQRTLVLFIVLGVLLCSIFVVNLTQFRRFQPPAIDMQPIVNFLQKDDHWRWRYMTLGFGDQMAWLSAQTTAAQVDGNYHSARRLPEMTTTPVERLEGAKFSGVPGLGSLQQFLNVPDKYNLKYIFSNDKFYDPLLFFYGWHQIQLLENGIAVWEREDIPILPEELPRKEIPLYQRLMFGLLPPGTLLLSLLTVSAGYWRLPFLLAGEMVGMRPHMERLYARLARPFHAFWTALDRRLLTAAVLSPTEHGRPPRWQLFIHLCMRRFRRWSQPASPSARQVRTALLAAIVVLLLVLIGLRIRLYFRDPLTLITAYYDDLDFRRFEAAYEHLNPTTRPPFDQYLINLSVQGGLIASYSKLEDLQTTVLQADAEQMQVQVDARYITALSYYTATQIVVLTNHQAAGWRLEPAAVDIRTPPDQFLRRPAIDWLVMGRRRVTTRVTDAADVLDRPQLQVLAAQLVQRAQGGYTIVGELINDDVNPADVTVTGLIYDDSAKLLTWYNAGARMMHKLFPQEITPFRIDFEGVAGLALADIGQPLSFTPEATTRYVLPVGTTLGHFDLYAKAVVTQHDLDRDLGVQQLRVTKQRRDGKETVVLQGNLINAGVKEAVIPHLLVTFYDANGQVVWVDHFFLPDALRPQRTLDFAVNLTPRAALTPLPIPGNRYPNSPATSAKLTGPRADWVALPTDTGYAYLRVSVNYFTGSSD
ncbi:MAG: hypothetical protein DYG89_01985 [Caldilinea sp. CFX5]|nr:hypothetical protein [Caldilinea sp. CFX5]